MRHVSRRSFLKTGSAAVVAAGAISAIPGLPAVADMVETQGPADTGAAETAVSEADATLAGEPLVAHVRDLTTGEIGFFLGTKEITVLDPQLAVRLINAAR
jgi:TAT (twin-arginine translocation) pathway signal sequence